MECILEWGVESFAKTVIYMIHSVFPERLKEFIENEARSCSMDFGCVTPQYVYRMWGGTVEFEDIEAGLKEIKNGCR